MVTMWGIVVSNMPGFTRLRQMNFQKTAVPPIEIYERVDGLDDARARRPSTADTARQSHDGDLAPAQGRFAEVDH